MPEEWRKWPLFDNIFRLSGVPVITVQLRYNGWVTELQEPQHMQNLSQVRGRTAFPTSCHHRISLLPTLSVSKRCFCTPQRLQH